MGDRLQLYDVLIEIVQPNSQALTSFGATGSVSAEGNLALQQWDPPQNASPQAPPASSAQPSPNQYFDDVVMPSILKLAETTDFKYVIGLFVMGFVLLVTILSVVPMTQLMRSGLEQESQRRALTIAQAMHDRFQMAMTNGTTGSFDTRFAEREPGVRSAFVISADGSILAPVSRAGAFASEPFVQSARRSEEKTVRQIDSKLIGASIPIESVDPETGLRQAKAFAMVLYDMGSLAVDNGQVMSLFIRVLLIAAVLGMFLFLILYKLMQAPFQQLHLAMDQSLRKGDQNVQLGFKLDSLQNVIVSVNSLLSRSGKSTESIEPAQKDVFSEATPLVRSMHNPAMAIDETGRILVVNSSFVQLLNTTLQAIEGTQVSQLQDEAISSLTREILDQSLQSGSGASTPIHLQGQDLELSLHPIRSGSRVDYYIVSLYDPNRDEVPT